MYLYVAFIEKTKREVRFEAEFPVIADWNIL